jgi:hypothetical protein
LLIKSGDWLLTTPGRIRFKWEEYFTATGAGRQGERKRRSGKKETDN